MAESTRAIATFLSVANFEDELHAYRIPEEEVDWRVRGSTERSATSDYDAGR
jgi:hypothetical protein